MHILNYSDNLFENEVTAFLRHFLMGREKIYIIKRCLQLKSVIHAFICCVYTETSHKVHINAVIYCSSNSIYATLKCYLHVNQLIIHWHTIILLDTDRCEFCTENIFIFKKGKVKLVYLHKKLPFQLHASLWQYNYIFLLTQMDWNQSLLSSVRLIHYISLDIQMRPGTYCGSLAMSVNESQYQTQTCFSI